MANRFRAAVKTTTVHVDGDPAYEFQIRYMGHGAIVRALAAHDGIDMIVEDLIDSLQKRSVAKSQTPGQLAQSMLADIEQSGMSVAQVAAKIITKAPDLAAELIAHGVVLEDDETVDDFIAFLDSLTLSQIVQIGTQWYAFNFEGGLGPFVESLTGLFQKGDQAAPVAQTPRRAGVRR